MTNQDINDYLRLAIMEEVNKRMGKNFECVNDLIDYAKNLEKENERLRQQIEKLKKYCDCEFCKHCDCELINLETGKTICEFCINNSLWELAE